MTDDRYEKGMALLQSLVPDSEERVEEVVPGHPGIRYYAIQNVFGDLFQRPQLSYRDREIVILSALTALGAVDTLVEHHLAIAKAVGLTKEEILEIMLTLSQYVGIPRAVFASNIVNRVLP
jgi:4-carboxymuconolactone decarboxylase